MRKVTQASTGNLIIPEMSSRDEHPDDVPNRGHQSSENHENFASGLMFKDAVDQADDPIKLFSLIKRGEVGQFKDYMRRFYFNQETKVHQLRGMWDSSPLLVALQYGQEEIAHLLLNNPPYNIEHITAPNEKGFTVAIFAVMEGYVDVVKRLLALHVPFNIEPTTEPLYNQKFDQSMIATPLSMAIINNHRRLVGLLLDNGCLVDSPFPFPTVKSSRKSFGSSKTPGVTNLRPIHLACAYAHDEIVRELIWRVCDFHARDDEASTLLHHLARAKQEDSARVLEVFRFLQTKACIDETLLGAIDENGDTPLHVACDLKHEMMVKLLLEDGADASKLNPITGFTPLHISVRRRDLETVKLLLEYGANPLRKPGDDGTPKRSPRRGLLLSGSSSAQQNTSVHSSASTSTSPTNNAAAGAVNKLSALEMAQKLPADNELGKTVIKAAAAWERLRHPPLRPSIIQLFPDGNNGAGAIGSPSHSDHAQNSQHSLGSPRSPHVQRNTEANVYRSDSPTTRIRAQLREGIATARVGEPGGYQLALEQAQSFLTHLKRSASQHSSPVSVHRRPEEVEDSLPKVAAEDDEVYVAEEGDDAVHAFSALEVSLLAEDMREVIETTETAAATANVPLDAKTAAVIHNIRSSIHALTNSEVFTEAVKKERAASIAFMNAAAMVQAAADAAAAVEDDDIVQVKSVFEGQDELLSPALQLSSAEETNGDTQPYKVERKQRRKQVSSMMSSQFSASIYVLSSSSKVHEDGSAGGDGPINADEINRKLLQVRQGLDFQAAILAAREAVAQMPSLDANDPLHPANIQASKDAGLETHHHQNPSHQTNSYSQSSGIPVAPASSPSEANTTTKVGTKSSAVVPASPSVLVPEHLEDSINLCTASAASITAPGETATAVAATMLLSSGSSADSVVPVHREEEMVPTNRVTVRPPVMNTDVNTVVGTVSPPSDDKKKADEDEVEGVEERGHGQSRDILRSVEIDPKNEEMKEERLQPQDGHVKTIDALVVAQRTVDKESFDNVEGIAIASSKSTAPVTLDHSTANTPLKETELDTSPGNADGIAVGGTSNAPLPLMSPKPPLQPQRPPTNNAAPANTDSSTGGSGNLRRRSLLAHSRNNSNGGSTKNTTNNTNHNNNNTDSDTNSTKTSEKITHNKDSSTANKTNPAADKSVSSRNSSDKSKTGSSKEPKNHDPSLSSAADGSYNNSHHNTNSSKANSNVRATEPTGSSQKKSSGRVARHNSPSVSLTPDAKATKAS